MANPERKTIRKDHLRRKHNEKTISAVQSQAYIEGKIWSHSRLNSITQFLKDSNNAIDSIGFESRDIEGKYDSYTFILVRVKAVNYRGKKFLLLFAFSFGPTYFKQLIV